MRPLVHQRLLLTTTYTITHIHQYWTGPAIILAENIMAVYTKSILPQVIGNDSLLILTQACDFVMVIIYIILPETHTIKLIQTEIIVITQILMVMNLLGIHIVIIYQVMFSPGEQCTMLTTAQIHYIQKPETAAI